MSMVEGGSRNLCMYLHWIIIQDPPGPSFPPSLHPAQKRTLCLSTAASGVITRLGTASALESPPPSLDKTPKFGYATGSKDQAVKYEGSWTL